MLDIRFIREKSDFVKQRLKARGDAIDLDGFLAIDQRRRDILQKIEKVRSERNRAAEEIAQLNAGCSVLVGTIWLLIRF